MKLIYTAILLISICSTTLNAAPLFQAGNIEDGQMWSLDAKSGIASYYANGKSGRLEFSCELQGKTDAVGKSVKALLRPGKNLSNKFNAPVTVLNSGWNGPFIWTFTNENEDVGNIKVFFASGSDVLVQCIGKRVN